MEDFLGIWKLVKKVNYDEFMKATGVAQYPDNHMVFETISEEDDYVVWEVRTSQQTNKIKFALDKEFQVNVPDGTHRLITVSLEGNQLIQVHKTDKVETRIICEVEGTNLIMTLKCDGVEAQRIYEKVVVPKSSNATTNIMIPDLVKKYTDTNSFCSVL